MEMDKWPHSRSERVGMLRGMQWLLPEHKLLLHCYAQALDMRRKPNRQGLVPCMGLLV